MTPFTKPDRPWRLGDGRRPPGTATAAAKLGIDVSGLDAASIASAVKSEHERRWKEEHREVIETTNAWVEKNGLPLAKYRLF
jgi:antitoxin CcdA